MSRRLKFGLCYIPDHHPDVQEPFEVFYEQMLEQVEHADALGFDSAWFAEHRLAGYGYPSPAIFCVAAAQRTRRIRLGPAIALLPLQHPIRTAEDYALVDLLSHGRLNFGMGRGLFGHDFDISNVPMHESQERFREAWEIIRRAWTEDYFTYDGRWTKISGHTLEPKPVQKPHPPVYTALVRTPETYRWAGANGYHALTAPFLLDPAEQQANLAIYREALAAAGHDPADFEVVGTYHLYIGDTPNEIEAIGVTAIRNYLTFVRTVDPKERDARAYANYRQVGGIYQQGDPEGAARDFQHLIANRAVIGTPEECARRIERLAADFGLTHLIFEVFFGGMPHERVLRTLERFAREVMPHFDHEPPPDVPRPATRTRRAEARPA